MTSTSLIETTPQPSGSYLPGHHPGRLRYASPRDLPSYPSSGLRKDDAAASAAASLGWANHQKPVATTWKPDTTTTAASASASASACAAAALANDYLLRSSKMVSATPGTATRESEAFGATSSNSAGSKAAMLAAGSAQRQKMLLLQQQQSQQKASTGAAASASASSATPAPTSARSSAGWGNSAANIAFKASSSGKAASSSHAAATASVAEGSKWKGDQPGHARQGSLHAAKGAMAGAVLRQRSMSSPQSLRQSYPDQANAASNALSAATIAHQPSMRRPKSVSLEDAGAVPYTTMGRQMFTSHPPVKSEVDEQRRADVLHASAVAMAKRMYNQQQKMIDTTKRAHERSSSFTRHGAASPTRAGAGGDDEVGVQPVRFNNLQEAAYRLAQERLSKLHEEHQKNREFQEYYGSTAQVSSSKRNRLGTIRGKLTRRRSASDSDLFRDEQESQRIRQQMSLFNNKLSEVDEKKRARDREAVLTAAQRNVKARLLLMDERLYAETGRVNPGILSAWEQKAQSVAQAKIMDPARLANVGKVDIGGGKFMDQRAVDEIAAKRVQPLLDEINEKAELERERQAALRLDDERRKEEAERQKAREREVQEIHKQLKDEQKEKDKMRKAELKQEEKTRKEVIKAAKAEQKQAIKEDRQKGKEVEQPTAQPLIDSDSQPQTSSPIKKASAIAFPKLRTILKDKDKEKEKPASPTSPLLDEEKTASSPSKMKNWLMNRLTSRPRAKSSSAAMEQQKQQAEIAQKPGSFVGGATLTRIKEGNHSTPSLNNRSASMRAVAMASASGFGDERGESSRAAADRAEEEGRGGGSRDADEDMSSDSDSDSKSNIPSIVRSVSNMSSDDKFMEARSHMESPLSPPPALRVSAVGRGSPVKESKFTEIID